MKERKKCREVNGEGKREGEGGLTNAKSSPARRGERNVFAGERKGRWWCSSNRSSTVQVGVMVIGRAVDPIQPSPSRTGQKNLMG